MKEVKDSVRSQVKVAYNGLIHKKYKGTNAKERFHTEKKILKLLESRKCPFTPKLIESDDKNLKIVTSNCGSPVQKISQQKLNSLFNELKDKYGIEHDDKFVRNITYDRKKNHFCIIDFELAKKLW